MAIDSMKRLLSEYSGSKQSHSPCTASLISWILLGKFNRVLMCCFMILQALFMRLKSGKARRCIRKTCVQMAVMPGMLMAPGRISAISVAPLGHFMNVFSEAAIAAVELRLNAQRGNAANRATDGYLFNRGMLTRCGRFSQLALVTQTQRYRPGAACSAAIRPHVTPPRTHSFPRACAISHSVLR
jgi:hypothetical protein